MAAILNFNKRARSASARSGTEIFRNLRLANSRRIRSLTKNNKVTAPGHFIRSPSRLWAIFRNFGSRPHTSRPRAAFKIQNGRHKTQNARDKGTLISYSYSKRMRGLPVRAPMIWDNFLLFLEEIDPPWRHISAWIHAMRRCSCHANMTPVSCWYFMSLWESIRESSNISQSRHDDQGFVLHGINFLVDRPSNRTGLWLAIFPGNIKRRAKFLRNVAYCLKWQARRWSEWNVFVFLSQNI